MAKALALAGGGSRGSYQIGAWQALQELGYNPDIVTGTSVGSMNAAFVVLGDIQQAKAMWLSITDRDVMDLPENIFSKETVEFVKNFAKDWGISTAPLEQIISKLLDEDKIRNSKCRYGLVTVNIDTKTPLELTIDDIPQGKLMDYMLASGACFPFLQTKKIDGQKYIDGGYYDNLPSRLAAKMGADVIVQVDLDGIGVKKAMPKKYSHVKIIDVRSHYDLGSFLTFDTKIAKRNMDLGYLDTYKAFGRLEGEAYAFKKGEVDKIYSLFGQEFYKVWEEAKNLHPSLKMAYTMHFKSERYKKGQDFLCVLEGAMAAANLPIENIYTAQNITDYIKKAPLNMFSEKFELVCQNTPEAKLILPLAVSDIKKVFLSLLNTVV